MQKHLVIFAKAPRLGRVKTRLARDVGKVAAWVFYRRMLRNIPRRLASDGRWTTWLAISPDETSRRCFFLQQVNYISQGTGDLGERMWRPRQILPQGPFIVIGTDIPDISRGHIARAFRMLGHNDAVFGPSTDGGFWLVGLKRHGKFTNPYSQKIRWSHPQTLKDCLANLKRHKIALIETLNDIDTVEDFTDWQNRKKGRS